MCWKSSNSKELVEKVATEDIETFKVVKKYDECFVPLYFQCVFYSVGVPLSMSPNKLTLLIDSLQLFWKPVGVINQGFHSYSKSCKIRLGNNIIVDDRAPIEIGSNKDWLLDRIIYTDNLHYLDCIIPKGSHYYVNSDGEYVSDAILPTEAKPLDAVLTFG